MIAGLRLHECVASSTRITACRFGNEVTMVTRPHHYDVVDHACIVSVDLLGTVMHAVLFCTRVNGRSIFVGSLPRTTTER